MLVNLPVFVRSRLGEEFCVILWANLHEIRALKVRRVKEQCKYDMNIIYLLKSSDVWCFDGCTCSVDWNVVKFRKLLCIFSLYLWSVEIVYR